MQGIKIHNLDPQHKLDYSPLLAS